MLRHDHPFDRAIPEGHLTGSAITVSADGTRVLLLHHRKLDRWLQPGGHGDPGETTGEEVALREALEESGIRGLALHPQAPRPLDVDVHDIPARAARARPRAPRPALPGDGAPRAPTVAPDLAELHELRWVPWDEVDALSPDHGLRRALAKARSIVQPPRLGPVIPRSFVSPGDEESAVPPALRLRIPRTRPIEVLGIAAQPSAATGLAGDEGLEQDARRVVEAAKRTATPRGWSRDSWSAIEILTISTGSDTSTRFGRMSTLRTCVSPAETGAGVVSRRR